MAIHCMARPATAFPQGIETFRRSHVQETKKVEWHEGSERGSHSSPSLRIARCDASRRPFEI